MNDIEWVAESDWSKVTVGQKVKLTKPDGNVLIRTANTAGFYASPVIQQFNEPLKQQTFLEYMVRELGWSLFVEAPPAVVLPTEPGHYLDNDGELWTMIPDFPFREKLHAKYAPFTRLEPVPETAKKVLDRIKVLYDENFIDNANESWNRVAREFGVIS
jgi:hypothetical protein